MLLAKLYNPAGPEKKCGSKKWSQILGQGDMHPRFGYQQDEEDSDSRCMVTVANQLPTAPEMEMNQ